MTLSEAADDGESKSQQPLLQSLRLAVKNGFMNRTGSSYIALFRPLDDAQSRGILFCAVVLSIAAGAPLPIIGVIFARIIDSFPPSEEEVRTRVSQLIAVGKCIVFYVPYWLLTSYLQQLLISWLRGDGLSAGGSWGPVCLEASAPKWLTGPWVLIKHTTKQYAQMYVMQLPRS